MAFCSPEAGACFLAIYLNTYPTILYLQLCASMNLCPLWVAANYWLNENIDFSISTIYWFFPRDFQRNQTDHLTPSIETKLNHYTSSCILRRSRVWEGEYVASLVSFHHFLLSLSLFSCTSTGSLVISTNTNSRDLRGRKTGLRCAPHHQEVASYR